MKKVFTLILALVLVLSAGAGAVADGGFSYMGHVADLSSGTDINFSSTWNAFQQKFPQYTLSYIGNAGAEEQNKKIMLAAENGNLPDVFWCQQDVAKGLIGQGYLADLRDVLAANPDIQANLPANMIYTTEDGMVYGTAYACNVEGFWYNKEVFAKYGVPEPTQGTTFDEMLDMVKVFRENNITTISNGALNPYACWAILGCWVRYGYFDHIDAILAGDQSWSNEDFLRYFQSLEKLAQAGAFSQTITTSTFYQAVENFGAELAAMLDSGSWSASNEAVMALGDKIGFWWGPTFADGVGDQKVSIRIPSSPIVVSKAAMEDPVKAEAIAAFLNFYYSQEAAALIIQKAGMPVIQVSNDVVSDIPSLQVLLEALSSTDWVSPAAGPDLIVPTAIKNQIYDSVYGVMSGVYTPEQALKLLDDVQAEEMLG